MACGAWPPRQPTDCYLPKNADQILPPSPVFFVYDCHSNAQYVRSMRTGFSRNRGLTEPQEQTGKRREHALPPGAVQPPTPQPHPTLHPAAPPREDLDGGGEAWGRGLRKTHRMGRITSKQSGVGVSGGVTYLPTCTQLQGSRTSLPHPHPLLVQISDLNENYQDRAGSSPCPPTLQGRVRRAHSSPTLF